MNTSENSQQSQEQKQVGNTDSNKLTIEVRRFQNLLEILKDRKKIGTLVFTIFILGVLLFFGITMIVLAVKRVYPYNDITINGMGTTTLRSENKDVSYFLLSSSELWANSGIKVKKGQTITIKSSGKKHSAIHHLVVNAQKNSPALRDPWVGAEGFPEEFDTRDPRDGERARYRIFPRSNQDILVMQIVADNQPIDRPNMWYFDGNENVMPNESSNVFIIVGNRMENIHIDMDGTLYFAINDIVLDDETIVKMIRECGGEYNSDEKEVHEAMKNACVFRKSCNYAKLHRAYDSLQKAKSLLDVETKKCDTANTHSYLADKKQIDSIVKELDIIYETILEKMGTSREKIEKNKIGNKYGKFCFQDGIDIESNKIELYGYFMNGYKKAWYEDNVGSFLILVETLKD